MTFAIPTDFLPPIVQEGATHLQKVWCINQIFVLASDDTITAGNYVAGAIRRELKKESKSQKGSHFSDLSSLLDLPLEVILEVTLVTQLKSFVIDVKGIDF